MTPEPFSSARTRIRPQVAAFNTPALRNSHYLNPVNLPWADLRAGAWLTIAGAVLGLVSAFWLCRRPAG